MSAIHSTILSRCVDRGACIIQYCVCSGELGRELCAGTDAILQRVRIVMLALCRVPTLWCGFVDCALTDCALTIHKSTPQSHRVGHASSDPVCASGLSRLPADERRRRRVLLHTEVDLITNGQSPARLGINGSLLRCLRRGTNIYWIAEYISLIESELLHLSGPNLLQISSSPNYL